MSGIEIFLQCLLSEIFTHFKAIWWPKHHNLRHINLIYRHINLKLMTLRNSDWSLQRKFHGFFMRRIDFRKYVKFALRENKKISCLSILGYLKRKSFHFLTNLWWLWSISSKQYWHSKECVPVQCLEATVERCSENW